VPIGSVSRVAERAASWTYASTISQLYGMCPNSVGIDLTPGGER
jgi:hypothetical protein